MMCLFNNKFCGKVEFNSISDEGEIYKSAMYLYDIADIAYTSNVRLAENVLVDIIRIGYIAKYDNDYHVKTLIVNDRLDLFVHMNNQHFGICNIHDFELMHDFVISIS